MVRGQRSMYYSVMQLGGVVNMERMRAKPHASEYGTQSVNTRSLSGTRRAWASYL